MKKIVIALIIALTLLALASCGNTANETPEINEPHENATVTEAGDEYGFDDKPSVASFMSFINEGEYIKAADYYNEKLYGNYTYESEVNSEVTDLLKNLNYDILSGEKTEADSEKVIVVIDKVISNTNLQIDDYEDLKENIKFSVASKAAFLAGKELEELNNYADAITEYKNVIETDANYNDAVTAIERCATIMKQTVFDKVKSHVDKNEFVEAISQLKELQEKLPDDEEVISKISVYEKTYISNTIASASEAFETPAEDYSKALEIINGALQFYPNNEELLLKKDYYNSFIPVKLASLPQYDTSGTYGIAFLESEKDPLGNIHTDVFRTWSRMYDYAWVVYILDGNYNKLTFTVYGTVPSDNEIASVSIRDYSQGDYELSTYLYVDETVKRGVFPYEVEVDVTGVKMIRVYVKHGIAVADAKVQRTVK